jgi:hypothetical protein
LVNFAEISFRMKKKRILIFILLIIVISICLVPFNKQVAIKINASYLNCYQQLLTLQNWKKWQPEISRYFIKDSSQYKMSNTLQGIKLAIPGEYFLVKQKDSYNLLVKKTANKSYLNYSYSIIPNSSGSATIVIVTFKTNIIKYLVPAWEENELKETSIFDFKRYMEDVKLYYGFNIKPVFATEKKYIVKSKTIAAGQIYAEAAESQKQLNNYILLKHLKQVAPMIMQYIPKSGDSLQMLVGVPVNKAIPAGNGFLYMYMPPTKILTGDFKGRYRDKQKIYTAIGSYLQDKFLHPKIAPFEVFENKLPTGADDVVNFRLTYPIF